LIEKSVGKGWNASIQTGRPETRDALDLHLWTYRAETFLAHGRDGDERPADQPVFLTVTPDNLERLADPLRRRRRATAG
jgi:DNA polymerase-3 subunit chi